MASIARADNCKECPTLNSLLWSRWNLTQGWLLRGVPSRLLCHAQNRSKWVKMGQESCRVANDLKISPPLPLHLPSKLHNKIKPPYVRLSSSWHKARFKHVCLHFQNNLNSSQVSQEAERKNKIQYIYFKICGQSSALGYDLWPEMKAPDHLDSGGQKDQMQPSLNGRGLLGFSFGDRSNVQSYHSIEFGSICRIVTLLSICVNPTRFSKHKFNHFQMEYKWKLNSVARNFIKPQSHIYILKIFENFFLSKW